MGPKRWTQDTHVNAHKVLNGELHSHLEDKEFLVLQEDARWWKGRGDGAADINETAPGEGAGPRASSHWL